MQYFGGKISAAQLQVTGWVGSVRRSLQGALELVWGPAEDTQKKEEEDKVDEVEEEQGGDGEGRFQRAMTPLRSFARRSRRSLRRFSDRSRQTLQRRVPETCSAPVNSYSPTGEDTDALIDSEPEQQNEACEQTSDIDSPEPVPDEVPEEPSEDPDTTDFSREPEQAPFPESSTPLLDTSAQRSKADLGKRRSRSRPPRSMRGGFSPKESQDWRAQDTTDEKKASSKQRDSDSEEEQPKPKIARSPPPSQRVPMFTGLNPASLIAQLKRRTGGGGTGGGEEKEENKGREEKESRNEEAAPSPSKPSRSPRPPARSPRPAARSPRPAARSPRPAARLAGAARVLPPIGGGGGGPVSSPAWLKELKSKKRLSQHNSEA